MYAVIFMGQSGSGKTYTLFGGGDGSGASEGFAMRAVASILNKIRHAASPEDFGIAVAFWEVFSHAYHWCVLVDVADGADVLV
jgi:hypothetical protein